MVIIFKIKLIELILVHLVTIDSSYHHQTAEATFSLLLKINLNCVHQVLSLFNKIKCYSQIFFF